MNNVLEINSLDSLNECMNLIDGMNVFVENALNEFDTLTLLEDAEQTNEKGLSVVTSDDQKRMGTLKTIQEKIIKAIKWIWEKICEAARWVRDQFNMRIRSKIPMIISEDVTVNKYCFNPFPSEIDRAINNYIYGSNYKADKSIKHSAQIAITAIENCMNETIEIKKGTSLKTIEIFHKLSQVDKIGSKISAKCKEFSTIESLF